MKMIYFISHPEVTVNLGTPAPDWDLSDTGLDRLAIFLKQPWIATIEALFSSNEQKAITTAKAIAEQAGLPVQYREELGEMDRSSTGPLPLDEFNTVVDEFFAKPTVSARGWERAIDAQQRIIKAVDTVISLEPSATTFAIVAHGGVGALLLSYLKQTPISRSEDQPSQGHYFVFDWDAKTLVHSWKAIDDLN